jgi:hypothetical protein
MASITSVFADKSVGLETIGSKENLDEILYHCHLTDPFKSKSQYLIEI